MPSWLHACLWALACSSALVLGALVGQRAPLSPRAIAAIMAFGSGVLVSALSFDLLDKAFRDGGIIPCVGGSFLGAAIFTLAAFFLNRRGARHRKRSRGQPGEAETAGSGLAIAAGAFLDGIPESLVIGIGSLRGERIDFALLGAFFLSNFPEGLSSAAGMKRAGRSARYIFIVWGFIALASGAAAAIGNLVFAGAAAATLAFINSFAAGAILAMLADTMIPEAFEEVHDFTGLITACGFLTAFALSRLTG